MSRCSHRRRCSERLSLGGGSLLNEWLARLGVGHILALDPQRVELTNLPRIVGATRSDALAFVATRRNRLLRRLAERLARYKVHIARRVAKQANPRIRFDAVIGDVLNDGTARLLTDVDFLFLAATRCRAGWCSTRGCTSTGYRAPRSGPR